VRLFPTLLHSPSKAPDAGAIQKQRLTGVLDTLSGARLAGLVQSQRRFEERARFGVAYAPQEGACLHLASEIETLANTISQQASRDAFFILPCPAVALSDANTAIACDAAVRRSGLLHQEVCLEFSGSALESDSVARLARLKRSGFRLGLALTHCGPVALDNALRVLVDAIRIDARNLMQSAAYGDMLDAAASAGVLVAAQHAHWRDGALLSSFGVRGFIQPRTDG
jgi:hypothetical protein